MGLPWAPVSIHGHTDGSPAGAHGVQMDRPRGTMDDQWTPRMGRPWGLHGSPRGSHERPQISLLDKLNTMYIGGWGWDFGILRGGIAPRDHFLVPGVLELQMYGRTSDPSNESYPPGGKREIDVSRVATVPARILYEPQPISDQLIGVGYPHRAGRHRPVASLLSCSGCWCFLCMEGFLVWG